MSTARARYQGRATGCVSAGAFAGGFLVVLAALKVAVRIAPQAEIDVFHAYAVSFEATLRLADAPTNRIDSYRADARQKALANMTNLVDSVVEHPQLIHCALARGDAPRQICNREAEIGADLIVMGKRGQSLVEGLFLGSVTRHLLSQAKCDVLVVPDTGEARIATTAAKPDNTVANCSSRRRIA